MQGTMLSSKFLLIVAVGLAYAEIKKVYTPPSFGSTSTTPLPSSPSYAEIVGGIKPKSSPQPGGVIATTKKPGTIATTKKPTTASPLPKGPQNLTFVIAARDLPVKKKGAKLDPYVKVTHRYLTLKDINEWKPVGETEVLKDTVNPDFLSVFTYEWTRGQSQQLQFEVKGKHSISKDEDVGKILIKVDEYVEKKEDVNLRLDNGGTLIVKKAEPVKFKLAGRTIPKLDNLNGLSDPFVECYWRKGQNGTDVLFHKTKVIEDKENVDWDETIIFRNYQKGANQWWHFKVYDSDSVTGNDCIGEVMVEVDPYVQKRATKVNQLSKDPKNKATLIITPA